MRDWLSSTQVQGLLSVPLMDLVSKFASTQLSGLSTLKLVKMLQDVQMVDSSPPKSRRLSSSAGAVRIPKSTSASRSSLSQEVQLSDGSAERPSLILQDDVSAK